MAFGWDDVVAYATALDAVELSNSYRKPALKAEGILLAAIGHEPETAFMLSLPRDLADLARAVRPDIFFQTPHYAGRSAVLVRYDADFAHVREWIDRAHEQALRKPRRRRKPG
jgi:hypothetical protein